MVYDLDLGDFVINYRKDDRDNVPHFLLSVNYQSINLAAQISPTAQQILAPSPLVWYLVHKCQAKEDRFKSLEINTNYKMMFDDKEFKFCFIDSFASSGGAMLLINGHMGTYLITGDFCFSQRMLHCDAIRNMIEYGKLNKLYFDATLYQLNGVKIRSMDSICETVVKIISDVPESQRVVVLVNTGLEFIFIRVMQLLRQNGSNHLCYVSEPIKNFVDELGYGSLFTSSVELGAIAKIYIHSNLFDLQRNFGCLKDSEKIKLNHAVWSNHVYSYKKESNGHVFSIIPHSTRVQCDKMINYLNPDWCFAVGSNCDINLYKILPIKQAKVRTTSRLQQIRETIPLLSHNKVLSSDNLKINNNKSKDNVLPKQPVLKMGPDEEGFIINESNEPIFPQPLVEVKNEYLNSEPFEHELLTLNPDYNNSNNAAPESEFQDSILKSQIEFMSKTVDETDIKLESLDINEEICPNDIYGAPSSVEVTSTSNLNNISNHVANEDNFRGFSPEPENETLHPGCSSCNVEPPTDYKSLISTLPLKNHLKFIMNKLEPANQNTFFKLIINKCGLDAFDFAQHSKRSKKKKTINAQPMPRRSTRSLPNMRKETNSSRTKERAASSDRNTLQPSFDATTKKRQRESVPNMKPDQVEMKVPNSLNKTKSKEKKNDNKRIKLSEPEMLVKNNENNIKIHAKKQFNGSSINPNATSTLDSTISNELLENSECNRSSTNQEGTSDIIEDTNSQPVSSSLLSTRVNTKKYKANLKLKDPFKRMLKNVSSQEKQVFLNQIVDYGGFGPFGANELGTLVNVKKVSSSNGEIVKVGSIQKSTNNSNQNPMFNSFQLDSNPVVPLKRLNFKEPCSIKVKMLKDLL